LELVDGDEEGSFYGPTGIDFRGRPDIDKNRTLGFLDESLKFVSIECVNAWCDSCTNGL